MNVVKDLVFDIDAGSILIEFTASITALHHFIFVTQELPRILDDFQKLGQ
jgi:hypothetical protein